MSANQETEEEDERIFPILDRNTPIIDRIQERRKQLNGTSIDNIANQIARSALTGESVDEELLTNLRADIAEELEIPEDQINSMYISKLRDTLSPSLEELVAQRSTGLQEPEESSEETQEQEIEEEEENSNQTEEVIEEEESENSGPAFPSESEEDQEESDDEPDSVF